MYAQCFTAQIGPYKPSHLTCFYSAEKKMLYYNEVYGIIYIECVNIYKYLSKICYFVTLLLLIPYLIFLKYIYI